MKVLFLIDDLMSGGTENNLLNFLRYREKQFDVKIATLFDGGVLEKNFRKIDIDVECINFSILGFLNSLKKLKQIVTDYEPDVVVCQRSISRAFFPVFLSKMNIKVVMHWDNPNINCLFKTFFFEKIQIKYAIAFVVSSKVIGESLIKLHHVKSDDIIPNCSDLGAYSYSQEYRELNSRIVKIISVGNLRKEKNHLDQLKIAQLLKNNGVNFRLDILGEGGLRKIIEPKIKELNLSDNVFLQGRNDNVSKWLNEADVFLFTSFSEGFGVAIIEAMVAGLPCVIYDLPVLKEIDPQGNSLMIIPQGDVEQAVKVIEKLISSREIRQQLGERSSELVHRNFSAEKICDSWNSFLDKVIESN